ncbi:hypothetical protein [uncultured Kordia sp.]|uniref:hypothetical protein n=1 Tax=uncultured Kordia sp. TaxID=507699 RepID=UPI00262C5367|nr:hypothetical protein [uncultured Kordia sp.]
MELLLDLNNMDTLVTFILSLHGLIWGTVIGIFIYLIRRRIRIKETEEFEQRDN